MTPTRPGSTTRRHFALGLASLLVLPAQALEAPEPPALAPSAPFGVDPASFRSTDYDWRDDSRQRPVPVRLYEPAQEAAPGERRTLVVFSHGIGGSRLGYSYLGAYLASQGLLCLHVQHVGSDRQVWTGNPFNIIGRLKSAAKESEAVQRVRDVRFALDQLLASDKASAIDPRRIVAAGHSYGANTTLLLAGAVVTREGQTLALADPRVQAAVIMSAPPFYKEPNPAAILGAIQIPTLHITATEDVIQVPGYHSPPADRIKVFEATGSPLKALAVFEGGSHNIFSDRRLTGGSSFNPKVKLATRELVLDFIHRALDGQAESLASWPARYKGLLHEWVLTTP